MNCSRNVLIVDQRPVAPCEPPTAWLGGKRHLARRICGVLAATPHDAYCEPFIGMGGVFLRRRVRPAVEVINDLSGDVVTLFRVAQRFPDALIRELAWRPAARAEFERIRETPDGDLLDIERAARFLYLQTLGFGGKVAGRAFGVSPTSAHNFDLTKIEPRLRQLHDRMAGVVIENLDWLAFISRYDRAGSLFYLDPPYWETEGYGVDFPFSEYERMAALMRGLKGKAIVSLNDHPDIRRCFAGFEMEAVEINYTVGGGQGVARREVIIYSWDRAAEPVGLF